MRKINSNGYAGKVILTGLLFLGLALVLKILCDSSIIYLPSYLIYAPLLIGAAILFGFCVLLGVELRQDKKLNLYYMKRRQTKEKLENGQYECQSCGFRNVRSVDKVCPSCGTTFVLK